MEEVKNKYTTINCEKICTLAPHHFRVTENVTGEDKLIAKIDFQDGPIKEAGVNGVQNEDLLVMVIERLKGFQSTQFACRENAIALTKLEEALMWLNKRTAEREKRGVEGTHTV